MADETTFGRGLFKISSKCPFASWNPGGALKTFYEKISQYLDYSVRTIMNCTSIRNKNYKNNNSTIIESNIIYLKKYKKKY